LKGKIKHFGIQWEKFWQTTLGQRNSERILEVIFAKLYDKRRPFINKKTIQKRNHSGFNNNMTVRNK